MTAGASKQTVGNVRDSSHVMNRRIVNKSWNKAGAVGTYNGYARKVGPFRAVNNLGDFLVRQNYSSGGANQINSRPNLHGLQLRGIPNMNDGSGVPPSTTNVKFVSDSSDYTRYKKQRMANVTYNARPTGGSNNHHINFNEKHFR